MRISLVLILLSLIWVCEPRPARPQSLPKTIWTYHSKEDNFIEKLCLYRMKTILDQSRWVLEVLSPENIFVYLHQHELYKSMIINHPDLTFRQQVQVVKLLILFEYGGIWIDSNNILISSLDWLSELQSLRNIKTYGNQQFQMMIFQSKNDQMLMRLRESKQQGMNNNGILLALKQSAIIKKWISKLAEQLHNPLEQELNKDNRIKIKSIESFNSIRQNKSVNEFMKQQKIWKFMYNDFKTDITDLASNKNAYILADFYLKYPITSSSNDQHSKYFICLSHSEEALNQVLDPQINKLAYLNVNNKLLGFQCGYNIDCAHYMEQNSIIDTYLIKNTPFQPQIQKIINKQRSISNQCAKNENQFLKYFILSLKVTFYLIVFWLAFKIQKICISLMWVKCHIWLKPKYRMLLNILKTVKGIIQYQQNGGV